VNDVTREYLAAIPEISVSGRRVARELIAIVERRGDPGIIVSDYGTEFTSNAVLAWAEGHRVDWHYIASFNARMRDEMLNETLFTDLAHALQAIEAWGTDYNTARPRSALAHQTPRAYAAQLTAIATALRLSTVLGRISERAYSTRHIDEVR